MAASVEVAVLAGGLGTRLRAALPDRPKALALVRGRPFLGYLLDQLARQGARRVVLCVGYLAEQIEGALGCEHAGLELAYSREASPLGTAGALRQATAHLRTERVLVLNGDSFCPFDLSELVRTAERPGWAGTLVAVRVEDASRYGTLTLDGDVVTGFFEKRGVAEPGWINAGIYLLPSATLRALPDGPLSLERDVLPGLVTNRLAALRSAGPFIDIGTPETLAAADAFFATLQPKEPS